MAAPRPSSWEIMKSKDTINCPTASRDKEET